MLGPPSPPETTEVPCRKRHVCHWANISAIPDFPKTGILFRDITPLLASPEAFRQSIVELAEPFRGLHVDLVAAAEARGFIFAAPLALELQRRADPHPQAG